MLNEKTLANLSLMTFELHICPFYFKRAYNQLASPEGRLSGDGVAVLRFPECLLDGLPSLS